MDDLSPVICFGEEAERASETPGERPTTTSKTNIDKHQTVQNAALKCCTAHTRDSKVKHYHHETKVLPIQEHMRMLTSQYREEARDPAHSLHEAVHAPARERGMEVNAFHSPHLTMVHGCDRERECEKERVKNKNTIQTEIVRAYLERRDVHPLLQTQAQDVAKPETWLPRASRRTLAQQRAQKCPLLRVYLSIIGASEDLAALCAGMTRTTSHTCSSVSTSGHSSLHWTCGGTPSKQPPRSENGRQRRHWWKMPEGMPFSSHWGRRRGSWRWN